MLCFPTIDYTCILNNLHIAPYFLFWELNQNIKNTAAETCRYVVHLIVLQRLLVQIGIENVEEKSPQWRKNKHETRFVTPLTITKAT
jgi:hypothetical protein